MTCNLCGMRSPNQINSFDVMLECPFCYVQFPYVEPYSGIMTNSNHEPKLEKISFLNKEQLRLIRKQKPTQIIDFGCGNGQLLLSLAHEFSGTFYGVELDSVSIEKARSAGLNVVEKIDFVLPGSVITFWHSLEHLKLEEIRLLLSKVAAINDLKLIIAVPNGQSTAWKMFGPSFAFYDPQAHYIQFSYESLRILLKEFNFEIKSHHGFFTYGLFNSIQTSINISCSRNKIYDVLKRGAGSFTFRDWVCTGKSFIRNFPHFLRLLISEFSLFKRGVLIVVVESRQGLGY
jgi:hypothetical protein